MQIAARQCETEVQKFNHFYLKNILRLGSGNVATLMGSVKFHNNMEKLYWCDFAKKDIEGEAAATALRQLDRFVIFLTMFHLEISITATLGTLRSFCERFLTIF